MAEKLVPLQAHDPLSAPALAAYVENHFPEWGALLQTERFPGGYSNLTYLLTCANKQVVLRRPPAGAAIQSAHDMGREVRVLQALAPHFSPLPTVYASEDDNSLLGTPFYLMSHLEGMILRANNAPQLNWPPERYAVLSQALVDCLVRLHAIDVQATGLAVLGKPDGYVKRQVDGWTARYAAAATDALPAMEAVAQWLQQHIPPTAAPAFLHNDFKYDNLILSTASPEKIVGILDWEMATVGDPLMDLGAFLAYWFEAHEPTVFRQYNLSWLPGNPSRQALVESYAQASGRDLSGVLFYYVFGLFKNAVIAQQIYKRWKDGFSKDPRFGGLLPLIQLMGEKAAQHLNSGKI